MKQPRVEKKIQDFFANYRLETYEKGHILVHAGKSPPGIFHIVTGEVRQYDISEQGTPVVVNLYRPLAFFPISWAINKTPNAYFFETITPAQIRCAPATDVLQFLKDNPDVLYDLLGRVFMGTDVLLRRMSHLMAGSARTRLLYELMLECRRFGQKQSDGSWFIEIHLYQLATRTGLSRETASREMSKMKHLGITVAHSGITIKDTKVLYNELSDTV